MSGNPLSASSLSTLMASSLPKSTGSQVKTPYEAVALFCHAFMIAVGFRLIGLGEDHKIETSSDAQDPQPLPSEWNASTSFAFRYAHSQSSMEYLIKVSRLGTKAVVFGIGLGDDKTASFDINVKDFISESSLPVNISDEERLVDALRGTFERVFIFPARITDLAHSFKLNILQKLMPSLHKEGYEESSSETAQDSSRSSHRQPQPQRQPERDPLRSDPIPPPARPHPLADPLAQPPRRPVPDFAPPGFEDEHQMMQPPRGYAPGPGGRNPLSIGDEDLYPPGLGPHDPLRGTFGPTGGGLPRPGGGGGMHPTFDDPLFGGRDGRQGGYNPQAPPGARYDPVHGGEQPFGSHFPHHPGNNGGGGGGGGGGGRRGGGPPNPFGGFGSGDFI
ncbi:MAG: hypothetical protein M1837_007472 [Sclerophora amabilis]|nr:MAG: hypothetical protein M1837_007472 [Sclerophora amabilis]